jgi:hypothetical protein
LPATMAWFPARSHVLVKTTAETETDLNTFTPGQLVRVSAANDAGESLLSDPVEHTVP